MSEVLTWARRWARRPDAAEHELLEVSRQPTLEAVRAAYHKLARFAHPDRHRAALTAAQLEEVTATFARVSNAYAVLSARLRRGEAARAAEPRGAATQPAPTEPAPAVTSRTARPSAPTMPATPALTRPPSAPTMPAPALTRPPSAPTMPAPALTRPPSAPTMPAPASATTRPAPVSASRPSAPTLTPAVAAATAEPRASRGDARTLPIGPANAMSPKALGHYRRAELAMLRGNGTEALLHLKMAIASDPQSSFLRAALADLEGR